MKIPIFEESSSVLKTAQLISLGNEGGRLNRTACKMEAPPVLEEPKVGLCRGGDLSSNPFVHSESRQIQHHSLMTENSGVEIIER